MGQGSWMQNKGLGMAMPGQGGGDLSPGPQFPPGPSDTVPAMLTPGEVVVNPEGVQIAGANTLDALNREGLKVRQGGGLSKRSKRRRNKAKKAKAAMKPVDKAQADKSPEDAAGFCKGGMAKGWSAGGMVSGGDKPGFMTGGYSKGGMACGYADGGAVPGSGMAVPGQAMAVKQALPMPNGGLLGQAVNRLRGRDEELNEAVNQLYGPGPMDADAQQPPAVQKGAAGYADGGMVGVDPAARNVMSQIKGFPQSNDYDMDAFADRYLGGDLSVSPQMNANDQALHFPDTYKQPNHPTFSNESIAGRMTGAPGWSGGSLPSGGESWQLRKPGGEVVASEAPWIKGGIAISPDRQRQLGNTVPGYADGGMVGDEQKPWGVMANGGYKSYLDSEKAAAAAQPSSSGMKPIPSFPSASSAPSVPSGSYGNAPNLLSMARGEGNIAPEQFYGGAQQPLIRTGAGRALANSGGDSASTAPVSAPASMSQGGRQVNHSGYMGGIFDSQPLPSDYVHAVNDLSREAKLSFDRGGVPDVLSTVGRPVLNYVGGKIRTGAGLVAGGAGHFVGGRALANQWEGAVNPGAAGLPSAPAVPAPAGPVNAPLPVAGNRDLPGRLSAGQFNPSALENPLRRAAGVPMAGAGGYGGEAYDAGAASMPVRPNVVATGAGGVSYSIGPDGTVSKTVNGQPAALRGSLNVVSDDTMRQMRGIPAGNALAGAGGGGAPGAVNLPYVQPNTKEVDEAIAQFKKYAGAVSDVDAHHAGMDAMRHGKSYEEGYARAMAPNRENMNVLLGLLQHRAAIVNQADAHNAGLYNNWLDNQTTMQNNQTSALQNQARLGLDMRKQAFDEAQGQRQFADSDRNAQVWNQLLEKNGGDPVKAYEQWSSMTNKKSGRGDVANTIIEEPRYEKDEFGTAQQVGKNFYRFNPATGQMMPVPVAGGAQPGAPAYVQGQAFNDKNGLPYIWDGSRHVPAPAGTVGIDPVTGQSRKSTGKGWQPA